MWTVVASLSAVAAVAAAVVTVTARRRRGGSSREAATRAITDLSRNARRQRGRRGRGTGRHFGHTPIKKYGDEHHAPSDAGAMDSSSGGGGDSSW